MFNECVETGTFPQGAKLAEVSPIYKKLDPLEKKNYRPVTILTTMSKIFEKLIEKQLVNGFFNSVLDDRLSAFRQGYNCQYVLLNLCEKWREALDRKEKVAVLILDLSKAFDCVPHSLLLAKLEAYGMSSKALSLIASYLSNRKQRVKISGSCSEFMDIQKGVPQGSILGPSLFNLLMNDIFYVVNDGTLSNYADDNSVLITAKCEPELYSKIVEQGCKLIDWCNYNEMEANPSKFDLLFANEHTQAQIQIYGTNICSSNSAKLLGVTLDNQL